MSGESVLERFDRLVERRRLPKRERLLRYPFATVFNSLRLRAAGALLSAGRYLTPTVDTVFSVPMKLIVPPFGDLWVYGAELDSDAEVRLTRFLLRELKAGDVVFDVGACIGYYSLLASALAGPSGEVHAFEPSPFALPTLRENLAGRPNARVLAAAMSDSAGKATFFVAPMPFIGTSSLRSGWQERPTERVEVETLSLDGYCRSSGAQPTLVMTDVEGAEDRVVSGGAETLDRLAPVLVVEIVFNPVRDAYRRAFEALKPLGYEPFAIAEDGGLEPLAYAGLDEYFSRLKRRYETVQDCVNDFDNLVFKKSS